MIFSVLPSTYLCCTYTINYEVLVLHIVCTFNYERAGAGGENRVQRNNCIVRRSTTIPDCGMAAYLTIQRCYEYRRKWQVEWANEPGKKHRQADLSKAIGQQWKSLTSEERHYWQELAKEKKEEHEEKYPDYVYRPRRSKDKTGRLEKKKVKGVRGRYEHDTVMSSQTPMFHRSNGPFGLNSLPVHQDFCQGRGFEASIQVSHSSYESIHVDRNLQANESFADMYITRNERPNCDTMPD